MKKFLARAERAAVRVERALLKIALSPELRPVEQSLIRKALVRFATSSVAVALLTLLADHLA